jgi:hypothetical protein
LRKHTILREYYWQRNIVPPEDLYSVKEVDRRLSYPIVNPHFLICDVGGAAGVDALPLAKMGKQCILVDINKDALRAGKIFSTRLGIRSKVGFIKASGTSLPFKSGVFDLVTCFSVLDHLATKESAFKAISEFSRITRNRGYTAITVPNKLFLAGSIIMKIKYKIQLGDFWEQRFTPKELRRMLIRSGARPLNYDSQYPTKIGDHLLKHNFPKFLEKIPHINILLLLAGEVFGILQKHSFLKLFGARMGYLSIRIDY